MEEILPHRLCPDLITPPTFPLLCPWVFLFLLDGTVLSFNRLMPHMEQYTEMTAISVKDCSSPERKFSKE